ncbi:hypothetical protein JCM11251_006346 [Rhodosporidiobolus azoricus]
MFSSPSGPREKRGRDEMDHEVSPAKRNRAWSAASDLSTAQNHQLPTPPPPPTPNFSSALAQQQQRALEQMDEGAMEREDVEMGGDSAMEYGLRDGEEGIVSNPMHPWNGGVQQGMGAAAPRMMHQLSNTSLSNSSFYSNDSSLPTTPLDLPLNEQGCPAGGANPFYPHIVSSKPSYPSNSNPTSFTDFNGCTHVFSSSPPLSVYPPPPTPSAYAHGAENPLEHAEFPMHAWSAASYSRPTTPAPAVPSTTTQGVMRMDVPHSAPSLGNGGGQEVIRELHQPVYGWDLPKQASTLNMGAHMI